jgi:RNA polymerase sigma factor for flagellar operon FliA
MDARAREAAILEHYPLVRAIAARVARRLPSHVDVNDLINFGVIGLIEALQRFDPTRGVPFKGFAEVRIHGAIMDALRGSDDVPRTVRRRIARLDAMRQQLRAQIGRDPNRDEMAHGLGLKPEEYDRLVDQAVAWRSVSLEASTDPELNLSLMDVIPADDETAEQTWIQNEEIAEVMREVERLSERERKVVTEFYFEGRPLKDIGNDLGVTEGRVSQIRREAVDKIHGKLELLARPGASRIRPAP